MAQSPGGIGCPTVAVHLRFHSLLRIALATALATAPMLARAQATPAPTTRFKPRGQPPPTPSPAEPAHVASPTAAEAYKQHMANGVKLFQDKNLGAALVEFEAAYRERPRSSPLVNIALCYKALFDYPKAIGALEAALREHAATMDAGDKSAAESAIAEMRGLLGTVIVEVSPVGATVSIDGEEQPASAAGKPISLGPGPHRFAAKAEGYAASEVSQPVASGDTNKVVRLALVADKGYLRVDARDASASILLDQKQVGSGHWAGLVTPGTHVIELQRAGLPPYAVQVIVAAGKAQDIRPGSGGLPITAARPVGRLEPVLPPPPAPPAAKKEPPPAPIKGPYALATAGLFLPTSHPAAFRQAKANSGGAGGLRVGYRINTPAAFELSGEYANALVPSSLDSDTTYTLSSWRLGLNLRLLTPGRTLRLVGTVGGGIVHDSVKFALSPRVTDVVVDHKVPNHDSIQDQWGECGTKCLPASGVDAFLQAELGLELDFHNVLAGVTINSMVQSARGIVTAADADIYDGSNPLIHVGARLHVGYAFW